MGYTREAFKGISWLGAFRILFRFFSYLKLALIARILSPAQFGTADIAILVLALVEIFTETGINVFLIQEKDEIDEYISTAWVVSIIRGFCISALIFLTAGLISSFFNSPSSYPILILISLVPAIRGFINPSVVKFLKNLNYERQFYYRSGITIVEAFTAILIVWYRQSPDGLVWGLIAGASFEVIISFLLAKPRPRVSFEQKIFLKVLSRGKWLTASGIFDYLYLNLDNIVIGRLIGTASLGLYMRAYSISLIPITEISDVFNQTTFPIYVKIADDKKRLMRAYLRTLTLVWLLVLPIGLLLFIFPIEFINIILGDKWLSIAPVLQILAIYGTIRAITRTTIGLFYSLHRQDIITKITAVNLIVLSITIIPFINKWGLNGAGFSALAGTVFSIPFVIYFLKKVMV